MLFVLQQCNFLFNLPHALALFRLVGTFFFASEAIVVFGVIFGVKACKENKNNVDGNKQVTIEYLQDEYNAGDTAIVRVIVFSDIEFKSIKYAINNGVEVDMGVKTGESKNHDAFKNGYGKYYIDTQVELLDISALTTGDYSIRFYTYKRIFLQDIRSKVVR